ncbi:hypothetical protein E2C01_015744 [Portunus trituberculatus]|uniref:Uncharacterized protein n=1 Tax=Portunus trituberculatus TaxID=210409 RepID=A0A5B7DNZ9_PORTR|nr:hypothetical protein [Portunus trituberculatus]
MFTCNVIGLYSSAKRLEFQKSPGNDVPLNQLIGNKTARSGECTDPPQHQLELKSAQVDSENAGQDKMPHSYYELLVSVISPRRRLVIYCSTLFYSDL